MTPDLTHEIIKLLFVRLGGHKNLPEVADEIAAIIDQQARKAFEASRKPRVPAAVSIINNYVSYLDYDHYKNEKQ